MNTRRKFLWSVVVLLVVVPILVVSAYLVRRNYKEHHYVTVRMGGRYPGEYRMTEQRRDELNRRAEMRYQQGMDKLDRQMKLHPHK